MENNLKKLFLAAVGGTALTYEKSVDIMDQMIEKGKMSVSEGKELTEDLKRTLKREHSDAPLSETSVELTAEVLSLREEVSRLSSQVDELRQTLTTNTEQQN